MHASSENNYPTAAARPAAGLREDGIEFGFVGKLQELKYEYRRDITNRAALEKNFREKFEALNRVKLTDAEFARLLDEIVTPDVFKASKILREVNAFKAHKKALMQQLFPREGETHPPLRFPEFQNAPAWEKKRLRMICERIMDGTHFSPKTNEGPRPYLTSKNIRMGWLDLSTVSYIAEDEHRSIYARCPVKKNDVLLTKDGANTGNCAINTIDDEFSLLSSVAVLRGDPEPRYARRVEMAEIEKNDFNLNISRYISTATVEEEIDLAVIHAELTKIEDTILTATGKHNEFLKELGLPLLPTGNVGSTKA